MGAEEQGGSRRSPDGGGASHAPAAPAAAVIHKPTRSDMCCVTCPLGLSCACEYCATVYTESQVEKDFFLACASTPITRFSDGVCRVSIVYGVVVRVQSEPV